MHFLLSLMGQSSLACPTLSIERLFWKDGDPGRGLGMGKGSFGVLRKQIFLLISV